MDATVDSIRLLRESTYFEVSCSLVEPGAHLARKMTDAARRGDVYLPECPSRSVLDHVTSRWGSLTLIALLGGSRRFSELSRLIVGVSDKMLSQTLRILTEDGFLERTAFLEVPVRVEYELSRLGREVAERLAVLTDWIEEHIEEVVGVRQITAFGPALQGPSASHSG